MMANTAALFSGLFVVPVILLVLGHRLRKREPRTRSRFWGGLIGYLMGAAVAVLFMLAPPVHWDGGSPLRLLAVHWAMLAGFLVGILVRSVGPHTPQD